MFETLSSLGQTLTSRVFGARRDAAAPPVLDGALPLLGHAVDLGRCPIDLLWRGYKQHGEIFSLRIPGPRGQVTALLGPDGSELFFRTPDSHFSPREVYRFTVPVFGKGLVYDAEPEVMSEQMGFLMPALRDANMRTYAELMTAEAERLVARWPAQGEVDMLEVFTEITSVMSSRCLLGPAFQGMFSREFSLLFHDLERGITPIAFYFPNLPLPVFVRRDVARRKMVAMLGRLIDERKHSGAVEHDFLQALLEARYRNGDRPLTHEEIAGLLLTVAFAGHHNSSVIAAWMTIELLQHPEVLAGVLAEQEQVGSNRGPVTFEATKRLELLERAIREAGRLHPPLVMLMRAVLKDVEYKGYTIRAGTMVLCSPALTHRLPEVFADPDRFDPSRYLPPREEDKRKAYALSTFGGGKHRCIGMQFAIMMQKVLWSVLLRRVEFELGRPSYEPDYGGFVVGPKRPATVRYRKVDRPYAWLRERRADSPSIQPSA